MTTNTIKTTANLLKAGLIGFVAAAGFGLLTMPAKADEINQDSVQTTQQDGFNNTSVNRGVLADIIFVASWFCHSFV